MLFRSRDKTQKERTRLKNRIKKTLDRAGFRPRSLELNTKWVTIIIFDFSKTSSTFGDFILNYISEHPNGIKNTTYIKKSMDKFEPFFNISLSSTQACLIRQNLYELDMKTALITLLEVELEKALMEQVMLRSKAYNLSTIPGISKRTAVWIIVETGGIYNFSNIREFLSYCGCAPMMKKSDETVYSAHINRKSNKYLRTIFFQAGKTACRSTIGDSGLKRYATRVKFLKRGRGKLAFSIVGAKIVKITYAILRDNVPFSDTLAQHKDAMIKTRSRAFQLVSRGDVKRCKSCLERVRSLENVEGMDYDISGLIGHLENILEKKAERRKK